MKKTILSLLLLSVLTQSAYAGSKTDFTKPQEAKGNYNPVVIYNRTGTDVAYVMNGSYGGAVYGIRKGASDVYHSGYGDTYATFDVGICDQMDINGGPCHQSRNIMNCSGGHYNADYIKSITINALNSCTITCLDGGSTSCKQSG